MQLGYGRATVKRWEAGETAPSADAEAALLALCREKSLLRGFTQGPLRGEVVTSSWLSDLLAAARLHGGDGRPWTPPETATSPPTTQYALSGEVAIAYQVFGAGPLDVVVTPGLVSHRELDWEHLGAVRFFERLASFARVIVFDKRGQGMSDRVPTATLEERIDDIRAVMDAAGSRRAALFGRSEGGPMNILFAATYPERTTALVLYGTFGRAQRASDYPFGPEPGPLQAWSDHVRRTWGTVDPSFLQVVGPSDAGDPAQQAWWARYQRISISPGDFIALGRMNATIDVRDVLPAIRVPTLVLHRTGDRAVEVGRGRHLAGSIPGARLVELPGDDHLPWLGDVDGITDAVEEFLTGTSHAPGANEVDTVLTTILCTALVAPGKWLTTTGSEPWRRLLWSHDALVRRELARYRGREAEMAGGAVLATFDGPARAVRCACAVRDAVRSLGLELRIGVHTGEVELRGDGVAGPAVQLGAALAALAAPGEVLVSGTVTDLVASSGLQFVERGMQPLEGIPGHWRLFSVQEE